MRSYSEHRLGDVTATLYSADALDCLDQVTSETVDLFVTSPPYFIGKEYDTSRSADDFIKEIRRVVPAAASCLRPGGSLCWQVGNHVTKNRLVPLDLIVANEMQKQSSFVLRNRIIWTFNHGAHAVTRFSGRHETILWYTKGEDYYFNLDSVRIPQTYPGKRHYKGPKKGSLSGNPLGKNPGDIWELGDIWRIPNVKAAHIEKTEHPCQYPTALVRRLIAALVPPAGLIVDPYLGSGTTAVSALVDGRSFIGGDIKRSYLQLAKRRLDGLVSGYPGIRQDVAIKAPRPTDRVAIKPAHFHLGFGASHG